MVLLQRILKAMKLPHRTVCLLWGGGGKYELMSAIPLGMYGLVIFYES